jgi:hypothetical protein
MRYVKLQEEYIWKSTRTCTPRGVEIAQSVQRRAARPRFDSRQGQDISLNSTESRPALGPTQPPIQWVRGALSPMVKRPGREADQSPPSTAEVKNGGAISPLPHTPSWHIAYLIKHKDKFTFHFYVYTTSKRFWSCYVIYFVTNTCKANFSEKWQILGKL